ncbi:hypothetical protein EMPS_11217 [Entomortierella parvispora]|uniref:Protein-tyrosine-phosphatase n=1 Tax=Entomortierella parvispora TaxID=205924 RepID=A0A9P3HM41_9FUNG|nr:hypothetical protein EMPS_11217 [Entomortierella parvispora]
MSLKLEPETMEISSLTSSVPPLPPTISTTVLPSSSTPQADALPSASVDSPRIAQPLANGNSNSNGSNAGSSQVASTPRSTEELARGPLGLTADEEEWVRSRMEYAMHDFEVLALAIKRYKWQLGQVPKDVRRLQSLKDKHMEDPFEFLRQLKTKEFRYPEGQKTLPAPTIEWSKYQYPPANPIVPTKPQTVSFLGPKVFASNNDRRNVVSLHSKSRSRAGSPSYERLRTVKDTARSLGIHVSHRHHQPQYPNQDTNGLHGGRIDRNYGDDTQLQPKADPGHLIESRPLSRQTSQEFVPRDREYSQTPSVSVGASASEMEGIVYSTSQPTTASGARARSATVTDHHLAKIHQYPSHTIPVDSHLVGGSSPGVVPHSSSDPPSIHQNSNNHQNRNITINHMSGSVVDIQPSKAKATSREGSGAREEPPKPPLFNIPWSDDEQRLLEKLLDEYPDEPVAAQRFQKISAAMGTRTPKQVASRVQKYFIKLVKAGLEAPGRMNYALEPKKPVAKGTSPSKGKKRKDGPPGGEAAAKPKASRPKKKEEGSRAGSSAPSTKKQKAKSLLGSGFGRTSGTQYLNYSSAPTVYMSEEDDEENVQDMMGASHGYAAPAATNGVVSHLGFACDSCGVEPILGTRYSCMNCEEFGGTDLCGSCFYSGNYQTDYHLASHQFQAVETAEAVSYGTDYGRSSSAGPRRNACTFSLLMSSFARHLIQRLNATMSSHQQPTYVDSKVLKALLEDKSKIPGKDYLVIDVRDVDYAGGHIPGGVNIPSSELVDHLPTLIEKHKDVPQLFFHCAMSQIRGPKAARRWSEALANREVETQTRSTQQVHILRGGFGHWQRLYKDDKNLVIDYQPEYHEDY